MNRTRRIIASGVSAFICLSLVAAQDTTTIHAQGPEGNTDRWTVAVSFAPDCLDPATCPTQIGNTIGNLHVYDPLVILEGDPMATRGALAESWEYLDDQTIRFYLREGLTFHDGSPVTADDVVYSLEIYRSPEAPRASTASIIDSVTAIDDLTVELTTSVPSSDLLGNLSRLFIMPRESREANVDGFASAPVGSGPYRFVSNQSDILTLEANPDYWQEVLPRELRIQTVADPATRVALLQSGQADIAEGIPLESHQVLEASGVDVVEIPGARTIVYPFNTTKPPFNDPLVRQAVNHAIDREALVNNLLGGSGVLLHGPWAPGWVGYDETLEPYAYDPERALELLAEAGYPDGFTTSFSVTSGQYLKDIELAQAMAAQLAEVGITVQLTTNQSSALLAGLREGTFDGITSTTWGLTADPGALITLTFGPTTLGIEQSPELAELVTATRQTVEPEAHAQAVSELGRYARDEALWLFVHAESVFFGKVDDNPWVPTFATSASQPLYWMKDVG